MIFLLELYEIHFGGSLGVGLFYPVEIFFPSLNFDALRKKFEAPIIKILEQKHRKTTVLRWNECFSTFPEFLLYYCKLLDFSIFFYHKNGNFCSKNRETRKQWILISERAGRGCMYHVYTLVNFSVVCLPGSISLFLPTSVRIPSFSGNPAATPFFTDVPRSYSEKRKTSASRN